MTSSLELEAKEQMADLEKACTAERVQTVLTFAKNRGFGRSTVTAVDGTNHSDAKFAVQLIKNAEAIAQPEENDLESLQVIAILAALERITHGRTEKDFWSHCAKLNYELNYEGIRLAPQETVAFFAQSGIWQGKMLCEQMRGNELAATMYCSQIFTLTGSLTCKHFLPEYDVPQELEKQFADCWKSDGVRATLEALLMTFGLAYLGKENEENLCELIGWMRSSDFYSAPARRKGPMSHYGGLAEHTYNVIYRQVTLQRPQTAAELGEIVIAATCHGFCKTGYYRPVYGHKKAYIDVRKMGLDLKKGLPQGYGMEPDKRVFKWEPCIEFEVCDQFPLPPGARSVHMATRLLRKSLTPRVAEAIEAHRRNVESNPFVDYQYMNNSLALYLHLADVLATMIDETDAAIEKQAAK